MITCAMIVATLICLAPALVCLAPAAIFLFPLVMIAGVVLAFITYKLFKSSPLGGLLELPSKIIGSITGGLCSGAQNPLGNIFEMPSKLLGGLCGRGCPVY